MRLEPLALRLLLSVGAAPVLVAAGCGQTQRPDGGEGLLPAGAAAPTLEATAHDGTAVAIGEPGGSPVVVYFYPKDQTPGCTREACAFRDVWAKYQSAGVGVVGVSADSAQSHREFADEHGLPFPLVADEKGEWARAFGVPTMAGMTKRVSFLVDASGTIAKVYPDVDPGVHADQVLQDAAALPSGN